MSNFFFNFIIQFFMWLMYIYIYIFEIFLPCVCHCSRWSAHFFNSCIWASIVLSCFFSTKLLQIKHRLNIFYHMLPFYQLFKHNLHKVFINCNSGAHNLLFVMVFLLLIFLQFFWNRLLCFGVSLDSRVFFHQAVNVRLNVLLSADLDIFIFINKPSTVTPLQPRVENNDLVLAVMWDL